MPSGSLPDEDHLSRYCKPTAVGSDGLPTTGAFLLRPTEDHLSVNWLEYFALNDLGAAVERVRVAFHRKGYQVRPNGRFAILGVGPANAAVEGIIGRHGRVVHLPFEDDQSHAGIFGYTADDFGVAVALRALVRREDVHPAVSEPMGRGSNGS